MAFYLIRDCRLLFHKNDYSDEFIDTNYYKQRLSTPTTVLLRTTLQTRTITQTTTLTHLGSNFSLLYVPHLDVRANSLLRNSLQIRQQLWFNHRCKDLCLIPAGLKIKSPLNTKEAISIVKSTCRRLVKARINDCHRRLNLYKTKLQQKFDQLKQRLPTNLLNIVRSIADRRSHKSATDCRTKLGQKLSKLYNKTNRRSKPDDKWVRNISSRPLDKTETQVLSYGLKHSITPRRILTEKIVASVEAALSRQRDLTEPVKDK